MANLFMRNETSFDHNGMVLTDAKITITEDVEGIFDLEMEYPLNDRKGYSGFLIRGNIINSNIYEWDPRGDQLFEIRKVNYSVKKGEKIVKVYAQAIARSKLGKNFVFGGGDTPLVPAGKTRKEAGQLILNGCLEPHNFYMGNLDTNTNTVINLGLDETTGAIKDYLDIAYMSPLKGFLGEEKSIIAAYGGEIVYNNFEINFVDERGSDNSFIIKSGKNLQELQQEISDLDNDNFATALIMVSADGLHLPNNEVIYSSNAAALGNYYKVITCDDVTAVDGTDEAINVVYAQLRERAAKKFADGIDKLPINNTVNFLQLANTEEYKNYAQLEKCSIGNNVTIEYEKANITATGRVTQIKFNPNLNGGKGKITEVTIGDRKKKTIIDTITNTDNSTNDLNDKHNDNKKKIKAVKKYTDDREKQMRVDFKITDDAIIASVSDLAKDESSHFEMTSKMIAAAVTSPDGGSTFVMRKDAIVQAIQDVTGTHKTIFDSTGQTIENGGFRIKNQSGDIVFWITDSGYVKLKDLSLDSGAYEIGSNFYTILQNMKEIKTMGTMSANIGEFSTVNAESLKIGTKSIYSYIVSVLNDYNLIS